MLSHAVMLIILPGLYLYTDIAGRSYCNLATYETAQPHVLYCATKVGVCCTPVDPTAKRREHQEMEVPTGAKSDSNLFCTFFFKSRL